MSYDKITKINEEVYLTAVRKYRTINDSDLAKKTGVARTSIWRFRSKNPEVYAKAKEILAGFDRITFSTDSVNDVAIFRQFPIIQEWVEIMEKKEVTDRYIQSSLQSIFNVCNALGVHPQNLDLDMLSDNVYKWKKAENEGLEYPKGCAYNSIRIPLRSFMMIMLGVTGEQLTIKGIGAEHGKGFGSAAKERILPEQRQAIMDNMRNAVYNVTANINMTDAERDLMVKEMKFLCVFMYYTATRITASLATKFNDQKSIYRDDYAEIHVLDKGKRGGIDWQKRLLDDGHRRFTAYVADRFDIPASKQRNMLPRFDSFIFPSLQDGKLEGRIMRAVMDIVGIHTKTPNHIWRHTFAQDWLHAMDGNYEVGAEIGGWKDIGTMKRCYGAVSESIIQKGLRKSMGLPVVEDNSKLLF